MLYQETREEVLKYAVKCLENGLIHGTAGNVSARVPGEEAVVITPSGIPYDTLSPEDLPVVSLHAEIIDGSRKPSSETPMHTAIYRARPNVNGVVHTHSMFATVFSILEKEIPAMMPPSSAFAPVPCAPFQLPGSEELAESVVKTLGTSPCMHDARAWSDYRLPDAKDGLSWGRMRRRGRGDCLLDAYGGQNGWPAGRCGSGASSQGS